MRVCVCVCLSVVSISFYSFIYSFIRLLFFIYPLIVLCYYYCVIIFIHLPRFNRLHYLIYSIHSVCVFSMHPECCLALVYLASSADHCECLQPFRLVYLAWRLIGPPASGYPSWNDEAWRTFIGTLVLYSIPSIGLFAPLSPH